MVQKGLKKGSNPKLERRDLIRLNFKMVVVFKIVFKNNCI